MQRARSITEHVYGQLRSELILCRLRPGARLRTNELSARFGVSLSGVREALSRLVSENLVVADPQRGFRAAPLSKEDLLDLSETTMGVEAMCIRTALKTGDAEWEERLKAACKNVLEMPVTKEGQPDRVSEDFLAAHHEFHSALLSACENGWMARLRALLHNQSERYRQLCAPLAPDLSELKRGYKEITEAALARDATRTITHVSEQFQRNVARFVKAMDGDEAVRFWADDED